MTFPIGPNPNRCEKSQKVHHNFKTATALPFTSVMTSTDVKTSMWNILFLVVGVEWINRGVRRQRRWRREGGVTTDEVVEGGWRREMDGVWGLREWRGQSYKNDLVEKSSKISFSQWLYAKMISDFRISHDQCKIVLVRLVLNVNLTNTIINFFLHFTLAFHWFWRP